MAVERLTIQQVMEDLNCSEYTVYRLMREGELGYTQVTPTVRMVRRDELEAYKDARDVVGKHRKFPRISHLSGSPVPPSATPSNLDSRRRRAN